MILDVALNTLCDPSLRDVYDLKLGVAPVAPNPAVTASLPAIVSGDVAQAQALATAVMELKRTQPATLGERSFLLSAATQTVGATTRSLATILRIVIGLFVLFLVVRFGGCMMSGRGAVPPPAAVVKAEEKLMIQSYFKKHGVRASNRAEVAALIAEDRRRDNELRQKAFQEQKVNDEIQTFFREASANNARQEQEKEWERQRAEAEARREALLRQSSAPAARSANED